MHDGIRRFIIIAIVSIISVGVLFAWRSGDDGRFDIFDLMAGNRAQATTKDEIILLDRPVLKYSEVSGLAQLNEDFKTLTARVSPAVVSISTGREINQPMVRRSIFGSQYYNERRWEPGLGSGVIVSADGYIVTNYHVIAHADKIEITLDGEDETLPVRVVRHDERLDIAILKIISDKDASRKFAHLSLGDSDLVETGEIVFAVGNPFGFKGTVTQGIISAKNRRLSDSSAELFQTNTIINPGNSGGPLVNILGEVIGINTAIYSGAQQQTWQGVGLAIASNDVKDVLDLVSKVDRPIRGYLGVSYRPTPGTRDGKEIVQIMAVEADSPAERAGILGGDIILEFDGHEVHNFNDFSKRVRRQHVGERVAIRLERDGEELELEVAIEELDEDKMIADRVRNSGGDASAVERRMKSVGIEVADVAGNNGVRIQGVQQGSLWGTKIREGDTIVSLGGYAVANARTLAFLMEKAEPDQVLSMGVVRDFGSSGREFGRVPVQIPALR
ncbi:MAG: trypsin-like peptidase domain-containing protein [Verrucomicrobiales bacterium]